MHRSAQNISTKGWRFVRRGKNKRNLHMSKPTRLEWVFCVVKFYGGEPREFILGVFVT